MTTKVKRTSEFVTIKVERHSINGVPKCMAWYGGKGRRRRICQFLSTSRFGTVHHCGAVGGEILELEPVSNCPPWKDAK